MLMECGVSLIAAISARSPAMLAFGSDSLVELLSAAVVLLQFIPGVRLSRECAARAAGLLLFLLAAVVAVIAALALLLHRPPEVSRMGIAVTVAALVVMPILAWLKRRQAIRDGDSALAADSIQSATCAYLAALTLAGLGVNALFHVRWVDPLAALTALPLLLKEGAKAWRGGTCGCC
jgi:divalent metal cation (Fe/Co/Zn/Cd) transporter